MSLGGDSGPSKYRMSVTTSGPSTPVVRRTMAIGWWWSGVPSGGVRQPFAQVGCGGPAVGGGEKGGEGGSTGTVGVAVTVVTMGLPEGAGLARSDDELPHAPRASADAVSHIRRNLRVRIQLLLPGLGEDTVPGVA